MNCPKCGKELNDGMLFCGHCGEEIRIVSDFDPRVDEIVADYTTQAGEVAAKVRASMEETEQKKKPGKKKKRPTPIRTTLGLVVFGALFLFLIGIVIYTISYFSAPYQYREAQKLLREKEYAKARVYSERAVALDEDNVDYLLSLLSCLSPEKDAELAEDLCIRILEQNSAVSDAWRVLASVCIAQERYEEANELLLRCPNEQITSQFSEYMAKIPEFSVRPGAYDEIFSLNLIANTKGTIYYTMDGTTPDETGQVFTSPILIETGRYEIRAVFVNAYGVKSQEAEGSFYVDQSVPSAPVVIPAAGEYDSPALIAVEAEENCSIYYTTDGSQPTVDSTAYTGPFSMPVGVTRFRFICFNLAGAASEETEVTFSLKLHANMSIDAAKNKLLIELMQADVIQDLLGSVKTGSGHNVYNYRYAVTVAGKDYYLYREYYEDDAGNSAATGTEYVVDVMDGMVYKAVWSEQTGDLTEEEIMKNPWGGLRLQNIASGSQSE